MIERARHAQERLDAADVAIDRIDAVNTAFKQILGKMDLKMERIEAGVQEIQGFAPLPKMKRVNLAPKPEKIPSSLPPIKDAVPQKENVEVEKDVISKVNR